jgi:hypothetical protein
MRTSSKFILSLTAFALLLLLSQTSMAQCAMCRANAESSLKNGSSVAKGLNSGILYLMAIPYLLLMFIFREQIKSLYIRLKARYYSK